MMAWHGILHPNQYRSSSSKLDYLHLLFVECLLKTVVNEWSLQVEFSKQIIIIVLSLSSKVVVEYRYDSSSCIKAIFYYLIIF